MKRLLLPLLAAVAFATAVKSNNVFGIIVDKSDKTDF